MNPIINNPFRTLGLLSNSKERDIQKQISIIKRYTDVGKIKSFDYDFDFLGDIRRSVEDVLIASNKLEQSKNKVHHSLFWFLLNNNVDDIALNHLKDGNIEKAKEIWNKSIKDIIITDKNYSSISNLTTLNLGLLTRNGSFDIKAFIDNLKLKAKLLSSETMKELTLKIGGDNILISKEDMEKEFVVNTLSLIKPYLDKPNGVTTVEFLNSFKDFPNTIQIIIISKFTATPISNIEKQIEMISRSRTDNKTINFDLLAEKLFKDTQSDIIFLKTILSDSNLQFQILANNLASEILQCSIEYFSKNKDNDEYDPGEKTLKLMKMAKSVVCNGTTKSRIDENIESVKAWIEDKPNRLRMSAVKNDFDLISKYIVDIENKLNNIQIKTKSIIEGIRFGKIDFTKFELSIEEAKDFVILCKPHLDNIEDELGKNDDQFLNISTAVGFFAEQIVITSVNNLNKIANVLPKHLLSIVFEDAKSVFLNALIVNYIIGFLKLDKKFKVAYNNNLSSLENLSRSLSISPTYAYNKAKNIIESCERDRMDEVKRKKKEKERLLKKKATNSPTANTIPQKDNGNKDNKSNGIIEKEIFKNLIIVFFGVIGLIIGLLIDLNNGTEGELLIMSMILGAVLGSVVGYVVKRYS